MRVGKSEEAIMQNILRFLVCADSRGAYRAGAFYSAAVLVAALALGDASAQTASLPGSFAVSSTGSATYKIPIAVPPGTAGMAPSLSLDFNSYDSQARTAGNSIVGIGWSVAGLPVISRCSRTMVQDGATGGINFDSNDRFCLDGQRLVAVSGSYGADGAEYRTEIESFSRVISHGAAGNGPAWFEAHTKSGQVMEFGHTTDSLILAQGKTTARLWALNKISDTKGNYYAVSYTNDTTNGQAYPTEINYTGNSAAGLSPYNKVQFVYDGRLDVVPSYQTGSLVQTTVRLINIKTFAGGTLVGDYRLAYQQGALTQASILNTVTLCSGDGSCLPATSLTTTTGGDGTWIVSGQPFPSGWNFGNPDATFNTVSGDFNGDGKADFAFFGNGSWAMFTSNGDGSFTPSSNVYPPGMVLAQPPSTNMKLIVGDANGDGKSDVLLVGADIVLSFLANGSGSWTISGQPFPSGWNFGVPEATFNVVSGDFNGDGKTDFAFFGNGSWAMFTSNGDGSFTPSSNVYPPGMVLAQPPSTNMKLIVGDANGDGKSDVLLVGADIVLSFLANGTGSWTISGQPFPSGWNFGVPETTFNVVSGDFNGDGKADFAFFGNGSWAMFTSNGDGSFTPSSNVYPPGMALAQPPSTNMKLIVSDINGDGKSDVLLVGADVVLSFVSKGDGGWAVSGQMFPNGWNFGIPDVAYNLTSGDYNGDGRTDFALFGSGSYAVFTSMGNGSFAPTSNVYQPGMVLATPPSANRRLFVGDIDGDGSFDFLIVGGDIVISFKSGGASNGRLTSISNGLGQITNIAYQPLTNNSVYTKDINAVYPVVDLVSPYFVVSEVSKSNGLGGTYSSTYSYVGAKSDLGGRGFLGFRQMKATDPQTGIVETTNYLQSFPYIGMVASTSRSLGSQVLGQSTSTFQLSNASSGTTVSTPSVTGAPYRVSVTQKVDTRADLDGTAMPSTTSSFQYDNYGNATQVAVSNSDGYGKTTTNTYTNDATNWLLGRLTTSSVTATSP